MSNTILIYDGTPEQRTAAQTLWETATFPRGFLEGHQIKLTFMPNMDLGGKTGRGGHIVLSDQLSVTDLGFVMLHEIGHLASFWCLTDEGRQQVLDAQGFAEWGYLSREGWCNGFATTFQPPGSGYPHYPLDNDLVRELMDACGVGQVTPTFSDVPEDHYAYEAIEWAAANGITIGYGAGIYGPDDKVTRAQMALFLQRAARRQ
jgi:hypothetical protein